MLRFVVVHCVCRHLHESRKHLLFIGADHKLSSRCRGAYPSLAAMRLSYSRQGAGLFRYYHASNKQFLFIRADHKLVALHTIHRVS